MNLTVRIAPLYLPVLASGVYGSRKKQRACSLLLEWFKIVSMGKLTRQNMQIIKFHSVIVKLNC